MVPVVMSRAKAFLSRPLFLVLLIPAVIKLFFLSPDHLFEPHTMAEEWIRSGEFKYHYLGAWNYTFQFPVYTALVAAFYLLGLGPDAVLVFQVCCGTATAWIIYRMALIVCEGRSYSRSVALAAAVLTGLNPFLAYYQVRVLHPFAWDTFLAMALLLAAMTVRSERRGQVIALFALAGFVMLDRPTLIVFLLPFVWRERRFLFGLRELPLKVLLIVVMILPLAGWSFRNQSVTGRWELNSVTQQMLWMGIQEGTEGGGHLPNGDNYLYLLSVPERHAVLALDPPGQSAFFQRKRKAELDAKPGLWYTMFAVKLKSFWLFRSHLGMGHDMPGMQLVALMYKVYAAVLFVLLLAALALRNIHVNVMLFAALALSVGQSLFYFETRHRLLIEPVLMLIGLYALVEIRHRVIAKRAG